MREIQLPVKIRLLQIATGTYGIASDKLCDQITYEYPTESFITPSVIAEYIQALSVHGLINTRPTGTFTPDGRSIRLCKTTELGKQRVNALSCHHNNQHTDHTEYDIKEEKMSAYMHLTLAIVFEVIATSALKASDGFSKLIPSLIVIGGYIATFYFFSLVLKTMPVGVAYAIWCGLGIVLVTIMGIVLYHQVPDFPAILGMSFILAGVCIINYFSKTIVH